MEKRNINTIINICSLLIYLILFILLFVLPKEKVILGVLLRGLFSSLVIYNALYLIFTDKPSFMIRKGQEKHRKFCGVMMLIVGLFGFITFLIGYGINGYPLFDWRTIF